MKPNQPPSARESKNIVLSSTAVGYQGALTSNAVSKFAASGRSMQSDG